MNASTYEEAIENAFDQLDQAGYGSKKTFSTDVHTWGIGGLAASLLIVASVPATYLAGVSPPSPIESWACILSGLFLAHKSSSYEHSQRSLNLAAGLFGRSLPLSPSELTSLKEWTSAHPRITQTVEKMSAQHPDGQINLSDFKQIEKAYFKARRANRSL